MKTVKVKASKRAKPHVRKVKTVADKQGAGGELNKLKTAKTAVKPNAVKKAMKFKSHADRMAFVRSHIGKKKIS